MKPKHMGGATERVPECGDKPEHGLHAAKSRYSCGFPVDAAERATGACTVASVLFGYSKPFTAKMCPVSDDISLWRQPAEDGKPDLQHGARGAQHTYDFRSRCRLDTHKLWASNWVMTGPRSLCAQHPRRPPPAAAPAAPRSPQTPRRPPMR